jgi:hypothetical protein
MNRKHAYTTLKNKELCIARLSNENLLSFTVIEDTKKGVIGKINRKSFPNKCL